MTSDILIVDDEHDIRMLLGDILADEGYKIRSAANSTQAFEKIAEHKPDLIIQDIWLQDSELDGLEILQHVIKEYPVLPVIMISGHGDIKTAVTAMRKGAFGFIEKPFEYDRLLMDVERALDTAELKRENIALKQKSTPTVEELVGNSVAVSQIRNTIGKVAPTGSRVLITGPAGVGKEVVARLLHQKSQRADKPFIVVNCAAMHPERMELELFGASEGIEDPNAKPGTFEQADGGTLLLDEVADMPLETQGKIVRVLQEQTFERVGGATRISVDVRVIATSNRDLQNKIEAGSFRSDLYYRLNVVPVVMPSLADRREDIPALADYFVGKAASAAGVAPRPFAPDTYLALQSYSWPGNVRQLRNVMDWLLIMATGEPGTPIKPDMLPPEITGNTATAVNWDKTGELMNLTLREAREKFERDYLELKLARCGDNISETARQVGMERSALHRKLKSLGISGGKD